MNKDYDSGNLIEEVDFSTGCERCIKHSGRVASSCGLKEVELIHLFYSFLYCEPVSGAKKLLIAMGIDQRHLFSLTSSQESSLLLILKVSMYRVLCSIFSMLMPSVVL